MQVMSQAGPLGFGGASLPAGALRNGENYPGAGSNARNMIDPSLPLPTAENNMGSAMEQRLVAKQQIEANLRARSEMSQAYGTGRRTHSRGQSMSQRINAVDSGSNLNPQRSHMISPPPSSSSHGSGYERQRGFQRESSVSPPPSQILTPPHREQSDNEATPQASGKRIYTSRFSGEESRPAYNAFNSVFGNSVSPPCSAQPEVDVNSQRQETNKLSRADSPTSSASSTHLPSRRSPSTGSSSVDEIVLRSALHNTRKQDIGVIGQNNSFAPSVVVVRQPAGPPGSADELGGKNFASRYVGTLQCSES